MKKNKTAILTAEECASFLLEKYNCSDKIQIKNCKVLRGNGSMKLNTDFDNAEIKINAKRISKQTVDLLKCKYNIYNTVAHEISHALLFISPAQEEKDFSYPILLASMEYCHLANMVKSDLSKGTKGLSKVFKAQRLINKNHLISMSEINANIFGTQIALEKYEHELSDDDVLNQKVILASLKLVAKEMQIFYDLKGFVNNSFAAFLPSVITIIKKYPEILDKFPIIKTIFDENLKICSPYELFNKRKTSLNPEFYDDVIIQWLINIDGNISSLFLDDEFKEYVGELIKKYIQRTQEFYDNRELVLVSLENEKHYSKNLRYKRQSIAVLMSLANKYGIDIGDTMILDSNVMFNTDSLIKKRIKKE